MRLRGCPTQRTAHAQACWLACWAVLLIGVLTAASTLSAIAQDTGTEQEAKTRLSKEELRARLQGGEEVQSAVVQGNDLIAILQEGTLDPTVEIKIARSLIEGGLDFTALPATDVAQIQWPKLWSGSAGSLALLDPGIPVAPIPCPEREDKETWIAQYRSDNVEKMYVVANPLSIRDSTILPRAQGGPNVELLTVNAHSTFFRKIDFRGSTFSGMVHFRQTTFGKARFDGTTFRGWASFRGAAFHGPACFGRTTFHRPAIFGEATFRHTAIFNDATLHTDVSFEGATFHGEAHFQRAVFQPTAFYRLTSFASTTFHGPAHFADATFHGTAYIDQAAFHQTTTFRDVTFHRTGFFNRTTFHGEAHFEGTTFHGTMFGHAAFFGGAHFTKLAFFKEAYVFGGLTLNNTLFETYADFRDTQIQHLIFYNEIPQIIHGRIDFRRAAITEAHFQEIVFGKDVNFSDTRFGVAVDATQPHQKRSKKLRFDVLPTRQTKCPQVTPDVATVFRFVTFEGHAHFVRTAFCGRTSLERVIFHKDANFTDATFQDHQASGRPGFSLSYVNFNTLRLKWSQLAHPASWVQDSYNERIESLVERQIRRAQAEKGIDAGGGPLEPLSEVFKSLEANFRRQNELKDANEAYYQTKRAELREARERQSFLQRLRLEIQWMAWGIWCGYGTRLGTVVFWTLGFLVLFTLIYWTMGDLQRHQNQEITRDFNFKWRLLDLPHVYLTSKEFSAESHDTTDAELLTEKAPRRDAARKFWEALRFSSGILFKIGYRDATVSGRIGKCDLRWIVRVEWVLGFILLAFLIYTLTNTQPLLYKLIHGVF